MKPAMPDVFSSHRYTVLSPYSDVRKQSAPTAVVAYSALRGTPPGDSFANSLGLAAFDREAAARAANDISAQGNAG